MVPSFNSEMAYVGLCVLKTLLLVSKEILFASMGGENYLSLLCYDFT